MVAQGPAGALPRVDRLPRCAAGKEYLMTTFLWIVYWIAFVVLAVAVFIVDRSEHWTEEQRKRYGLGPRGQGR
jgi:hypothetical protein